MASRLSDKSSSTLQLKREKYRTKKKKSKHGAEKIRVFSLPSTTIWICKAIREYDVASKFLKHQFYVLKILGVQAEFWFM